MLGSFVKTTGICTEMFPKELLEIHNKENNNEHYLNINSKMYLSSVS